MRFGAMQSILKRSGLQLFRAAAEVGFDGVELNVREGLSDPLFTTAGLAEVKAGARETRLAVPSLCLGALNRFGYTSEAPEDRQRTTALIRRAIDTCGEVGARVILVPFFGRSEIRDVAGKQRVVEGMQEVAPLAERAGVILGLENTLSAQENLALIEQIGAPVVRVYFDVANATWWGHDSPEEIRRLGGAIAQVHFKDCRHSPGDAMLGEGRVSFPAVVEALRAIGYDGWVVLESAAPHDPVEDARANLRFSRACFGLAGG